MLSAPRPSVLNGLWVGSFLAVLAWSALEPKDTTVWLLEAFPALVALALILATRRRFPLTPLLYSLILAHCIILLVGAHYTYAEVPLFDWLRQPMGWSRNNYDKLGHFAQGFVPALLAREILLRRQVVNGRAWLNLFVVSVCLAFSAFYELLEWWVALLSPEAGDAFLGTQGYLWDTQSDMAFALLGAVLCLALLGRWHDEQLQRWVQAQKK